MIWYEAHNEKILDQWFREEWSLRTKYMFRNRIIIDAKGYRDCLTDPKIFRIPLSNAQRN